MLIGIDTDGTDGRTVALVQQLFHLKSFYHFVMSTMSIQALPERSKITQRIENLQQVFQVLQIISSLPTEKECMESSQEHVRIYLPWLLKQHLVSEYKLLELKPNTKRNQNKFNIEQQQQQNCNSTDKEENYFFDYYYRSERLLKETKPVFHLWSTITRLSSKNGGQQQQRRRRSQPILIPTIPQSITNTTTNNNNNQECQERRLNSILACKIFQCSTCHRNVKKVQTQTSIELDLSSTSTSTTTTSSTSASIPPPFSKMSQVLQDMHQPTWKQQPNNHNNTNTNINQQHGRKTGFFFICTHCRAPSLSERGQQVQYDFDSFPKLLHFTMKRPGFPQQSTTRFEFDKILDLSPYCHYNTDNNNNNNNNNNNTNPDTRTSNSTKSGLQQENNDNKQTMLYELSGITICTFTIQQKQEDEAQQQQENEENDENENNDMNNQNRVNHRRMNNRRRINNNNNHNNNNINQNRELSSDDLQMTKKYFCYIRDRQGIHSTPLSSLSKSKIFTSHWMKFDGPIVERVSEQTVMMDSFAGNVNVIGNSNNTNNSGNNDDDDDNDDMKVVVNHTNKDKDENKNEDKKEDEDKDEDKDTKKQTFSYACELFYERMEPSHST